jgi:hypothetical protein
MEKPGVPYLLVFYMKNNHNQWTRQVLLESNDNIIIYDFINSLNNLHLVFTTNFSGNYKNVHYLNYTIDTTIDIKEKDEPFLSGVNIYPNPTNKGIHISYTLASKAKTSINVYKISGPLIYEVHDKMQMPGEHKVYWGSTLPAGERLPGGLYLVRVRADDYIFSRSVVIM